MDPKRSADAAVLSNAWKFASRAGRAPNRDEAIRRTARLLSALHVAHDRSLQFGLAVSSDRDGGVELSTVSPLGRRWVDRVLSDVYEPGQWAPVRRATGRAFGPPVRAVRRGLPPERPGDPPEWGSANRETVLALTTIPRGVRLSWSFTPAISLGRSAAVEAIHPVPHRVPRGTGPVGRTTEPGRPGTGSHERFWKAELTLELASEVPSSERGPIASGLARAAGASARVELRFVFRPLFAWRRAFLLSDTELVAILPARDGPSLGHDAPTMGLPIGRLRSGAVIRLPIEAHEGRHAAILGETGMGKSSLLVALATEAARWGTVVVLDPLGETAESIRRELLGARRSVRSIDAALGTPSMNALAGADSRGGVDAVRSERRLADLVHALRRVRAGRYADSGFWGPRLEEMLGRALRAAASFPGGTLVDAHTLLATSGRTRLPAPPTATQPLRELADRMRERPDDADGARRLLYEVVANPTLAAMLCAREPETSFGELLRSGEAIVVAGQAARVGEVTARYVLAVALALLWSELLAAEAPRKTFVVLDEAQWFAHETLSEMLRLARRVNVHVVLATQSIESLPEGIREAVWTNAADVVAFRGRPEEARELSRIAPGVDPERMLALGRGEAVVLIGKGSEVRTVRTSRRPHRTDAALPGTEASSDVREPAPELGVRSSEPGPASLAGMLEYLQGQVGTPAGPVRVPSSEVAARFPDDPTAVRRLGAWLGRAQAIVRTERGADGPVWWVDPGRLGRASPRSGSSPANGTREAQPS